MAHSPSLLSHRFGAVKVRPTNIDGKTGNRIDIHRRGVHGDGVKTTVDIPDPLYRRAKIRAVETGRTLKDLVVDSLEHALDAPASGGHATPYWSRRELRPGFRRLMDAGLPWPGADSTEIISKDRSERDDSVL